MTERPIWYGTCCLSALWGLGSRAEPARLDRNDPLHARKSRRERGANRMGKD